MGCWPSLEGKRLQEKGFGGLLAIACRQASTEAGQRQWILCGSQPAGDGGFDGRWPSPTKWVHAQKKPTSLCNACSETLFGSVKVKRLQGHRFVMRRQAKKQVIDGVLWYKRTRLRSTLACVSPVRF